MTFYHSPKTRQFKVLAPGVRARTFWGENLMLAVVEFDANASIPPHKHPHEQAGTVLFGEIEFNIAGESKILNAGDVYLTPSEVEHSAISGDGLVQVLDIFTPVRQDLTY